METLMVGLGGTVCAILSTLIDAGSGYNSAMNVDFGGSTSDIQYDAMQEANQCTRTRRMGKARVYRNEFNQYALNQEDMKPIQAWESDSLSELFKPMRESEMLYEDRESDFVKEVNHCLMTVQKDHKELLMRLRSELKRYFDEAFWHELRQETAEKIQSVYGSGLCNGFMALQELDTEMSRANDKFSYRKNKKHCFMTEKKQIDLQCLRVKPEQSIKNPHKILEDATQSYVSWGSPERIQVRYRSSLCAASNGMCGMERDKLRANEVFYSRRSEKPIFPDAHVKNLFSRDSLIQRYFGLSRNLSETEFLQQMRSGSCVLIVVLGRREQSRPSEFLHRSQKAPRMKSNETLGRKWLQILRYQWLENLRTECQGRHNTIWQNDRTSQNTDTRKECIHHLLNNLPSIRHKTIPSVLLPKLQTIGGHRQISITSAA